MEKKVRNFEDLPLDGYTQTDTDNHIDRHTDRQTDNHRGKRKQNPKMPPQTPRLTRTHHPTPTTITSLAFSTKLQTIATTALDGILYITKPSATYKLTGHRGAIYASDIVHEENQIVTGGADGTVRVWKNQV